MFDWQTLAVVLIILGALVYTGRRGLSRLRSFRAGTGNDAGTCATGCGGCGEKEATQTAKVLVQISPKTTTKRHATRR